MVFRVQASQSRKKNAFLFLPSEPKTLQDCDYAIFFFARYLEQSLTKLKCLRGVGSKEEKIKGEKEVEEPKSRQVR